MFCLSAQSTIALFKTPPVINALRFRRTNFEKIFSPITVIHPCGKFLEKTVLNLLKATLIVLLSLFAAGMLAGVVFGEKIKQLAIRELNKGLPQK